MVAWRKATRSGHMSNWIFVLIECDETNPRILQCQCSDTLFYVIYLSLICLPVPYTVKIYLCSQGFPFLFQQIKDCINLHQTRNLIFSLCRWNERLANQIVAMIFTAIHKFSDVSAFDFLGNAFTYSFKPLQRFNFSM